MMHKFLIVSEPQVWPQLGPNHLIQCQAQPDLLLVSQGGLNFLECAILRTLKYQFKGKHSFQTQTLISSMQLKKHLQSITILNLCFHQIGFENYSASHCCQLAPAKDCIRTSHSCKPIQPQVPRGAAPIQTSRLCLCGQA